MRVRLSRRYFFAVIAVFTAIVFAFIGIVVHGGRQYARVAFPQKYWLLVRDCEESTSAAIIVNTYLSGGAGYLIGSGNAQAVVLACYYSEVSVQSVQRTLDAKGVETRYFQLKPKDLTLNGKSVSQKSLVSANASTVDSCARILYDAANGLERASVSQEEARSAVRGVVGSLKGLREGNGGKTFDRWNAALYSAERKGTEIASGILFAKDLRYMQVQLCYAVGHIRDYF